MRAVALWLAVQAGGGLAWAQGNDAVRQAEGESLAGASTRAPEKSQQVLTLATNGLFRGISRTDDRPALRYSLRHPLGSGFFLGATAATVYRGRWGLEGRLEGGFRADLGHGWEAELGLQHSRFLRSDLNPTTELGALLRWNWFTVGYWQGVSGRWFEIAQGASPAYVMVDVVWPYSPRWQWQLHYGVQRLGAGLADRSDFAVGMTYAFRCCTFGVSLAGLGASLVERGPDGALQRRGENRWVGTFSYRF